MKFVVFLFFPILFCFFPSITLSSSTHPNIIFVFADDLGFNDVGWNGNTNTLTPFLDNLALEESLLLPYNYVEFICTPSRAAFLTGRYPQRFGMQHFAVDVEDTFALTLQESLISTEFKIQGYNTHIIGKWHVGHCSSDYTPLQRDFDTYYGFLLGEQYYFTHEYSSGSCTGYDQRDGNLIVPVEQHYNMYGPYLQRDYALKVLSQYVNNVNTDEDNISDSNADDSSGITNDVNIHNNEDNISDSDADDSSGFTNDVHIHNKDKSNSKNNGDSDKNKLSKSRMMLQSDGYGYDYDNGYDSNSDADNKKPFFMFLSWQLTHLPAESLQELYDYYAAANKNFPADMLHHQAQVQALDILMGDVVSFLKVNGLWDNTLLVFSSDNGAPYGSGDNAPLRGYKTTLWEGGIRVPGFVSGGFLPESRRGLVLDNNIIHVTDWYPTLLSAAGLEVTYATHGQKVLHPIDGIDMWDVIKGDSTDSNLQTREVLLSLDPYSCGLDFCGAIRYGNYKFILSDTTIEYRDEDGSTCFWGRDFAVDPAHDILGCGAAPLTYTNAGYDSEDDIPGDVTVATCTTSNCAKSGCLYDLSVDPCEYYDISTQYPDIAQFLYQRLYSYNISQAEPLQTVTKKASVSQYSPKLFDGYWSPFLSSSEVVFEGILKNDVEIKNQKYEEWLSSQETMKNPILSSLNDKKGLLNNVSNNKIYIIIGSVVFVMIFVNILLRIYHWMTTKNKKNMSAIDEKTPLIIH